jgi:mediator of RNA polymerase II transcription subunit 12
MQKAENDGYLVFLIGASLVVLREQPFLNRRSLQLLRTFYAEDLVDHRTFLTWLVQQMLTCHLAQACFLIRLAEEYLDDILTTRALSRLLVEACLTKLLEVLFLFSCAVLYINSSVIQIRTSYAVDILKDTELLLEIILQVRCYRSSCMLIV